MELDGVLNDKQKEAACYLDSNLRIIAGAGSGKTRVITYRIAYLIENIGISPNRILAITFTNKAANEMKERISKLLGDFATGTVISTIHSLCVRILRANINVLGYPHNFTIMDEEDQKALLKKIYPDLNIDAKQISIKSCLHYISTYKCNNVSPSRAIDLAGDFQGEKLKAKAYEAYEKYKEEHFLLDFDDLLLKTVYLLENYDLVREKWQNRFDYIHVDEFQDVSDIEYRLIKLLSSHALVCVVGDPDQTIYTFRGADVNFILDFEDDFSPAHTVILEQNYRSTGNILNVSNALIRKNSNRLEKNLFTNAQKGAEVIHYTGRSEKAEAEFVCDKINEIIENHEGVNYHDFAILYRANYLSRTIEQELIHKQMEYRIFGGLKFFNRKEVKDALSYIRLVVNHDDLAFERVVNVPARGIGKKTLEKIQSCAGVNGISLYDALTVHTSEIKLSSKNKKELSPFITAIENAKRSTLPLHETFEQLMNECGYMEMLQNDLEDNRIRNIEELKQSIYDYENSNPDLATFDNYLQDIALYTDSDTTDNSEYISLMSIHMAKGLEFNYVFVIGLSEDIFPSSRTISESEDGIEEERRLAYVAFTRAKKQLYLTESNGFSFVSNSPKVPSRFLYEIGKENVRHVGATPQFKTENYVNMNPSKEEMIGDNQVDDWSVGDLVMHDVFGKGVVVKVDGSMINVAFAVPYGIKTLMAKHKAIHKLLN